MKYDVYIVYAGEVGGILDTLGFVFWVSYSHALIKKRNMQL
jgi:hypothetical protein